MYKKEEKEHKFSAFSTRKRITEQEEDSPLTNTTEVSNSSDIFDKTQKHNRSQMDELAYNLRKSKHECMICIGNVHKFSPIYTCKQCHTIFHLTCIKDWARSRLPVNAAFECPHCKVDLGEKVPNTYYCHCGKVKNPKRNPYLLPHCCGKTCGKKREGTPCPSMYTPMSPRRMPTM